MRKLSILIALILCVTIGGVYATWTYPGNEIGTVNQGMLHNMGAVTFSGSYGEYNVQSNSLELVIDQDPTNAFTTKLTYKGSLVLTFVPHDNISEDQLNAAKNATVTIIGSDLASAKYDSKDIWNLPEDASISLTDKWTQVDSSDNWTCTINCEDLTSLVSLANTFVLDNHDKYHDFDAVQKLAVFRVVIKAATVAAHA